MVVLVLVSPILPSKNNFVKALRKKFPEISTVVINVNDRKTSMVLGERNITVFGKGFIEDELCGCTFRISPTSFYQVNPQQTEKLYRKAISCAKLTGNETFRDLVFYVAQVLGCFCQIDRYGKLVLKRYGNESVWNVEQKESSMRRRTFGKIGVRSSKVCPLLCFRRMISVYRSHIQQGGKFLPLGFYFGISTDNIPCL